MGFNIRLVDDVIEYFETSNKSGILFFADFQKAFDSLDWNFMYKTLEFFNFGQSFIRWIKTIYTLPVIYQIIFLFTEVSVKDARFQL